jgi:CRISPR-associated endonuclease/helicase Cas3
VKNKERYFKQFNRYEFKFDLTEKSFNTFLEEISEEVISKKNQNVMIVLNTIDSCKKSYEFIKNMLSVYYNINLKNIIDKDGICIFPDTELINLSTHILPDFRLKRINRIKKDNKRKVIVSTQLVEAGVDISVDLIYRDMAPLDCIIQTAGRCNRHNQKQGRVNVVLLKDDKTQRTYCSYIYDSVLIDVTEEILRKYDQIIPEKNFILNAGVEYYDLVGKRKSKQESAEILDHLAKLNFEDITGFRLIQEKLNSASIFVEINNKAESIRKKIEEILTLKDRFEKRNKLLKIKSDMNRFILSVQCNKKVLEKIDHLPSLSDLKDFKYIIKKELDDWYKLDVGFYLTENINNII